MPIKVEHEDKEIEAYTTEEVEQQKQAAIASAQGEWETKHKTLEEELAKERKFRAEQTQNFKLLRDMTEEEKAKLTAEQIESRKIAEQATQEVQSLRASIDAERKANEDAKRESLIESFTGGNAELRAKLEAELPNVAIEDVEKKMIAAAKLAGLYGERSNPIRSGIHGAPPTGFAQASDDKKIFFESGKGKDAMDIISKL